MAWTPLHAALGETGGTLQFELIQRACDEHVRERADLDWKRVLPLTAKPQNSEHKVAQQLELAKDIAAMANSGGGMIVYGVRERLTEGTSAAEQVVPVGPIDETTTKAIRQVAGSLIYPPVTGTQLIPSAPIDTPDGGVLVLLVPNSPDTPHLIHVKGHPEWFRAPYRHGPETQWMVERQIADAYQAREFSRRRRQEDFDDRFSTFAQAAGGDLGSHWVLAMAVPDSPARPTPAWGPVQADDILSTAWSSTLRRGGLGPRDLTEQMNTRPGYRSFVRQGRRAFLADRSATARARTEVHADGTVAVAFTRDGGFDGEFRQPGHVAITDFEAAGLDLFALLWAARTELGVTGDYTARITVYPPTQIFRAPNRNSPGFVPFHESERVLAYRPVNGAILADEGRPGALRTWVDLINDAVNQTGFASVINIDELLTQQRW